MTDLRPSFTLLSVIYMANCVKWLDHYCKTECQSSGECTLKLSTTRALAGEGGYGSRLASCLSYKCYTGGFVGNQNKSQMKLVYSIFRITQLQNNVGIRNKIYCSILYLKPLPGGNCKVR